MKIGLISNPLSRANRKSGGVAARVTPSDDICVAAPRDHQQLVDDLIRFAQAGVGLIAVDGGDGTVRDIISNLDRAYPGDWPMFVLLPSGKTNVISGDVGHFGAGIVGWQRLMKARDAGTMTARLTECPAIEISWPGTDEPKKRGFLLGFAAFSDGVRMANESIHSVGINKGLAVAMTITGVLWRSLFGGSKNKKPSGETGKVLADDAQINGDRHFLMVASTLNRLTLGLRPFWKQGSGALNWLDISAPPNHIWAGFLRLALGRPKPWMKEAGYHGGRAAQLDVYFDQPFVLDGELYEPHGHVRVRATKPIIFVSR